MLLFWQTKELLVTLSALCCMMTQNTYMKMCKWSRMQALINNEWWIHRKILPLNSRSLVGGSTPNNFKTILMQYLKSGIFPSMRAKLSIILRIHGAPALLSSYSIDDTTISTESSHRDLGIIMSSDPEWSNHYDSIYNRANRTLGAVEKTHLHNFAKNCLSTF